MSILQDCFLCVNNFCVSHDIIFIFLKFGPFLIMAKLQSSEVPGLAKLCIHHLQPFCSNIGASISSIMLILKMYAPVSILDPQIVCTST